MLNARFFGLFREPAVEFGPVHDPALVVGRLRPLLGPEFHGPGYLVPQIPDLSFDDGTFEGSALGEIRDDLGKHSRIQHAADVFGPGVFASFDHDHFEACLSHEVRGSEPRGSGSDDDTVDFYAIFIHILPA